MTVVVATLGSRGDLHPFLAIARAMKEQGQRVVFLSQEPHRSEVEAQGLVFEAVASGRDHQRTMEHPDLWHPIRGFGVLWRHLTVPAIEPTVAVLERLAQAPGEPLRVLASPLAIGARLAADVLPFKLITAHTAPSGLRSLSDPMFIGAWKVPSWMPRAFRAQLWRLLDTKKLNPMAAPALNAWRATQSLPPIDTSIFGTWLHAKGRVIGLFPSNFGPVSPDWPPHLELCGFPLYEAGQAQNDEELNRFCSEAEGRLLVWYPGSTATTQQHVMRESAIELARQGAKCLWLQSTEQKIFQHAGLNWMVRPNTRLPSVLRKARLFVHHGGIGATAQGWAAGVPQIIKPSAYDQFENKWRLQSLTAAERQRTTEAKDSRELVRQIKAALQKEPAETRFDTFEYSQALDPNGAVRQAIASILRN